MDYPTTTETGNGWFVALGILLIITGFAALTFPFLATLSVEIFIGLTFLAGGIFTIFHAFWEKAWGGFFWQVLIGLLNLIAGIALLVMPIGGVFALTIMLGIVFAGEGIARMIMAFRIRPDRSWGWLLASGGISLLLGILVLGGMASGASLVFVGFLLGVNLVAAGASFVAIGAGVSQTPSAHPA